MNEIIKEELQKCNFNLPKYDENTVCLFIPKRGQNTEKIEFELTKDHYYIIKLAKYILYPPENFDLDSNWNNGIHPRSEYMLATPIKFIGKMIQFDACGYNYDENIPLEDIYNGLWLPSKGFQIIEMR